MKSLSRMQLHYTPVPRCSYQRPTGQPGSKLAHFVKACDIKHFVHRPRPAVIALCSTKLPSQVQDGQPDIEKHDSHNTPEIDVLPVQKEQERELAKVETLIQTEARYEVLAAWVAAAVAFGAGLWYVEGAEKAQEFFAGYILEQSLSIDNLFVFVLVFNYFQTPLQYQPKVLNYGIITAAVLRLVMIVLGVELIQSFHPILIGFAAILLFSSYQLLFGREDGDDDDLSDNIIVKYCQKLLPVSSSYDQDNFFTYENGTKIATPLLLTLAVVELSDVLFAVDSIPAVFGVTLDPFIVYTSNIFAILSLRSLYTFVSTVMTELRFLDKAVASVLGFIGMKMLVDFAGYHIPTSVSLEVVGVVLAAGVGASLAFPVAPEAGEKQD